MYKHLIATIAILSAAGATSAQNILDMQHVELNASYNGAWTFTAQDENNGVSYTPGDALLRVNASGYINRPAGSQFDFLGVAEGGKYYNLPQSQSPNRLYLGVAAYDTSPGTFDLHDVSAASKGRIAGGQERWLKWTLLDVKGAGGAAAPGFFSVFRGGATPSVLLASFNDGIANPDANGLDVTDGISADDALWVTQGGHNHYSWGFSEAGRYDVTFQVSSFLDNGDPNTLGALVQSQSVVYQFEVLSTVAPEPSALVFFALGVATAGGALCRRRRRSAAGVKNRTQA